MSKRETPEYAVQVIEDNAGGLHMAIFDRDEMTPKGGRNV
jgi:hypothetical protein